MNVYALIKRKFILTKEFCFATSSDFLIPISLHPYVEDL